ncbi:MAG TPA: hypothetical protein VGK73_23540 [Polyangiaceae bacterium]
MKPTQAPTHPISRGMRSPVPIVICSSKTLTVMLENRMNVRWDYRFGVPAEEEQRRKELEARIEAWWSAFAERRDAVSDLFGSRASWDLPAWMSDTLQAIDEALMWEYGPALRTEGHRLVITPESRRDLRPLVRHVLRAAPALPGWEFYAHRLPEPLELARFTVEGRCGTATQFSEASVSLGEHNRIDLKFSGPEPLKEDTAVHEAFVLTEALLGEEVLDVWVGRIEVQPRPKRGLFRSLARTTELVPLADLRAHVESLISSIRERQIDMTSLHETEEWSLLELKPEQQADYTGQEDLFLAKTPNLPLWEAVHAEGFHDQRFGRAGEIFCYLKVDGSNGLEGSKFADKGEIEDALDAALQPAGRGRSIGGGTGLRYSYVDLALQNPAEALPAIRALLSDAKLPKRSFILFHDCERRSEWVGVYDDTPAPP